MKKAFVCFLTFIFLCGCAKPAKDVKPVLNGISFTAKTTFYNENYTLSAVTEKDGTATFCFKKPTALSGLTVIFKGDTVNTYFNGIDYSEKTSASPLSGVCKCIYSAFAVAGTLTAEKDNKNIFIKGTASGMDFTLYITSGGLPVKLTVPDVGLTAEFYDLTI